MSAENPVKPLSDAQLELLEKVHAGKEQWWEPGSSGGKPRKELPYIFNEGIMIPDEVWLATCKRLQTEITRLEAELSQALYDKG